MNSFVFSFVLIFHILVGAGIIGLVLMQHGKGADMGASFGGGASGSLFGATGSANFLSRTTGILAAIFFTTSLGLSYLASTSHQKPRSIMDGVAIPKTAPAASGVAPKTPVPGPATTPSQAPNSSIENIPK